MRNLVNLYNFFLAALEESGMQMKLMIVQAKDDEKSKCSIVMMEIVAYAILREQADFHRVLTYETIV